MVRLHLELDHRVDSPEQFARDAGAWLTEAAEECAPPLVARLPTDPVLRPRTARNAFGVMGPPDTTWALLRTCRDPGSRRWSNALYSRRAWDRVVRRLADPGLLDVNLSLAPLDSEGRLVNWWATITFGVRRHRADPRWVQFHASLPSQLLPWPESPGIQERLIGFLERWAVRLPARYGHLTDDAAEFAGTALEQAIHPVAPEPPGVPRCAEVLRGYSWVTICAGELVDRLGGPEALERSGAFHTVRELATGDVLLRATSLLEQYRQEAPERVFRVLAPVLPPGHVPRLTVLAERLAVDVDAADHQRGG